MTKFSPEYLAQLEQANIVLAHCHDALDDLDELLKQPISPDMVITLVMAIGEAATTVKACSDIGVMPHDVDEVTQRLLRLTIRANHVVGHLL